VFQEVWPIASTASLSTENRRLTLAFDVYRNATNRYVERCQCSALARELKRAKRILARPRRNLAAVSNTILGRGHLGTQLARSHTEWPIKDMITSGLSLLQTRFPSRVERAQSTNNATLQLVTVCAVT
jgi:hypothetical protein